MCPVATGHIRRLAPFTYPILCLFLYKNIPNVISKRELIRAIVRLPCCAQPFWYTNCQVQLSVRDIDITKWLPATTRAIYGHKYLNTSSHIHFRSLTHLESVPGVLQHLYAITEDRHGSNVWPPAISHPFEFSPLYVVFFLRIHQHHNWWLQYDALLAATIRNWRPAR